MATRTDQLLSIKSKAGRTYYAFVDASGIVKATEVAELANVSDFKNHMHPGTKAHPERKGRIAQWLKSGGIYTISYTTPEERKANRAAKRAIRKEHDKAVAKRTRDKLLNHPDREFTSAFLAKQERRVKASAGSAIKKQAKAELRAKAILEKAGLKATGITAK